MIIGYLKKALIVPMILFGLSIASCNKDNDIQQETEKEIQIETLRNFLAEQMDLDPSSIVFNHETQAFRLPGEYDLELKYEDVLDVYNRDKNQ